MLLTVKACDMLSEANLIKDSLEEELGKYDLSDKIAKVMETERHYYGFLGRKSRELTEKEAKERVERSLPEEFFWEKDFEKDKLRRINLYISMLNKAGNSEVQLTEKEYRFITTGAWFDT